MTAGALLLKNGFIFDVSKYMKEFKLFLYGGNRKGDWQRKSLSVC